MELKKIEPRSSMGRWAKGKYHATISYRGFLYLNSMLARELKAKGFDRVDIYYACSEKGLVVVLRKGKDYKILYRKSSADIQCKPLADLLVWRPKIKTDKIEFKENEVWIYFDL